MWLVITFSTFAGSQIKGAILFDIGVQLQQHATLCSTGVRYQGGRYITDMLLFLSCDSTPETLNACNRFVLIHWPDDQLQVVLKFHRFSIGIKSDLLAGVGSIFGNNTLFHISITKILKLVTHRMYDYHDKKNYDNDKSVVVTQTKLNNLKNKGTFVFGVIVLLELIIIISKCGWPKPQQYILKDIVRIEFIIILVQISIGVTLCFDIPVQTLTLKGCLLWGLHLSWC